MSYLNSKVDSDYCFSSNDAVNNSIIKASKNSGRKKLLLFNNTLYSFYLQLYGVGPMVKGHSAREETC